MSELITIEELITRLGHDKLAQLAGLGSHNTTEGRTLDVPKINAAISFASNLMGGYISKRYPLAVSQGANWAPETVKGFVSDVAHYRLRLESGDRNVVSDEVRQRYNDAVSWGKDVSRGLVNIDIDGDTGSSDSILSGSVQASIPSSKADKTLEGYIQ